MIEIHTIVTFDKEMKRLSKKYHSIIKDYAALIEDLKKNPHIGVDLGNGIRKVRMAIASKGKGKSGGARVITDTSAIISVEEGRVTLLTIYDKSDRENISNNEIIRLQQEILRK